MSKVKIQGNASGTGVVTLTAPNTNTDRTITLPDGDITLGGGVDGIVSTANATAITIDASEQVGIGTASPAGLLHISGSTTTTLPSIVIERTGSGSSKWDIKPYADTLTFRSDATTDRLTLTNDGRGLSQFTAKAWLNYNGQTNAVNDSHNISSVTDNGTGDFSLNFTTAMANANYSISGTADNGSSSAQFMGMQINSLTTAAARMWTVRMDESDPEAGNDRLINCYHVFGD
jgi:hypothetical protein